jgi:hypothetical protein
VTHLALAAAALALGVVLGLMWTGRRGHGEHSFYDPLFSVSAVAARVKEQAVRSAPKTGRHHRDVLR